MEKAAKISKTASLDADLRRRKQYAILCFKPGRKYTSSDISNRLKTYHDFEASPKEVLPALVSLRSDGLLGSKIVAAELTAFFLKGTTR